MRNILLIFLLLLVYNSVFANKIITYEYWFDDNFDDRIQNEINTQSTDLSFIEDIDFTSIVHGIHKFNIRFKDSLNKWSVVQTSFFYKSESNSVFELYNYSENSLKTYEYWFDDNFVDMIRNDINAPKSEFSLIEDINFTNITQGLHKFNIRFKDSLNKWSVVKTSFFYKSENDSIFEIYKYSVNALNAYEYWFDDNFDARKSLDYIPNSSIINLDDSFLVENLNSGIHKFNIRFKDNQGKWSVAQTSYFYKSDNDNEYQGVQYPSNKIYGYRWWFDNNPETMVTVLFENKNEIFSGIINLQCPKLDSIGLHTFHIQFIDSVSKWSVAVSDTFLFEGFVISKPKLKAPAYNSEVNNPVILEWFSIPYISNFYLQISDENDFSNILVYDSVSNKTQYEYNVTGSKTYFWRIRAEYDSTFSEWSDVWSFYYTDTVSNDEHTISLKQGWNIISTYVEPENKSIPVVWDEVKDNLVIVKNNNGQTYIPTWDIDDIVNWNKYEGYQAYMTQNDELTVIGSQITPENTDISLTSGWKILPYLRNSPMNIETAVATLTNNDALIIAKNNAGQAYIPEWEINDIGNMVPGQGYQMYLSKNATLTYPANSSGKVAMAGEPISRRPQVMIPEFRNTGNNSILLVLGDANDGDEIGIYSNDERLIGSGVFTNGKAAVTIWGDNPQTPETDGAKSNYELRMKNYDVKTGRISEVEMIEISDGLSGARKGNLTYSQDAFLLAKANIEKSGDDIFNFVTSPNPFSDETTVEFNLPTNSEVSLQVFNLNGMLISTLADGKLSNGQHKYKLSGTHLASGEYTVILTIGNERFMRKVVRVR